MKILVDMNLAPQWSALFKSHGWHSEHWSDVGNPTANDAMLFAWARKKGYIIFTHDLDFGILLALSHATGPSVIQLRIQDVLPGSSGERVVQIIKEYQEYLQFGALLTIDLSKSRIRLLPIG